MAFELNQTAVSAVALLRAIDAGGWTSNRELAVIAGRPPQNIARDLSVIRNEGLIEADRVALSDKGKAQLAAIARAEGAVPEAAAPQLADDERLVTHAQMRPDDETNPRKDFESEHAQEKLDELRQSILTKGLLQNLVCRPDPTGAVDYVVTAGNRRWYAIAQAIYDNDWPEDRLIRIKVREGDDRENLLTAVVENMQRANMTPIEEAEAFGDLVNKHGMKTLEISAQSGLSQKVIQNRLKLLKLSVEDQERMRLPDSHPDHLGYKAALKQLTVSREPEAAEPEPENDAHRLYTVADFGVPADWSAADVDQAASWLTPFSMEQFSFSDKKWRMTIQVAQLEGSDAWVNGTSLDGPSCGNYSTLNGVWSARMAAFPTRERAIEAAAAYLMGMALGKASAKAIAWLNAPTADEPGSPLETPAGAEAPSLGKSLTPAEALILAEVTDKVERWPHPIHPSYTFCLPSALQANIHHLVARELLATRTIGDATLIRTALLSGGVKAWLDSIGFYADREAVLFELAARVEGPENAINRQQGDVRYATPWLNQADDPRNEVDVSSCRAVEEGIAKVWGTDQITLAREQGWTPGEPEQPALIEETEEERAARWRVERMAREADYDDRAIAAFTETMRQKMARKRAQGATGWSGANVNDLATALVGHVAKGDPVDIALFAMMVDHRAQALGYQRTLDVLRQMPTPRMEQLMIEARADRGPSPDAPEKPDPVSDFIEAELDEAEAEVDSDENLPIPQPHEPAVPIRKSITADFIVCLEDGRKFKSLKRHLRVKYNLSPEEYRAKWGLPADYPMVAPNYAKARAELAAQMGLRA